MQDLRSLCQAVLRRIHFYDGRSSWPLISGDTYRAFCDIKFDSWESLSSLSMIDEFSGKVFVRAGIATEFFSRLAQLNGLNLKKVDLIIHNGDLIPEKDVFERWHLRFSSIASVNWLHSLEKVSALPIGLENWSYLRNGIPRDFNISSQTERDIVLLVSFNDHTNPGERKAARDAAESLPGVYVVPPKVSPRNYRKLVRRSNFVLSPPGNGPDCHRTWEALYLGAIPIVKSAYWPFKNFDLPVVTVDSWDRLGEVLSRETKFTYLGVADLCNIFLKEFNDD